MGIAAATLSLTAGCLPSQVAPTQLSQAQTVQLLSRAWESADAEAAGDLAAPGAASTKTQLSTAAANIRLLGLQDVSVSQVDGSTDRLRLTWRLPALEQSSSSSTVRVSWVNSAAGRRVAALSSDAGVIPLWLLEPLRIVRAPQVLVAGGAGSDVDEVLLVAKQAQQTVKRALPEWDGNLVVEVPSSQDLLEVSLASQPGSYDAIAAVASSSDGSADRDVAQRVLLNPEVFEAMEASAAGLVMTHEVVHVATRASSVHVPLWWAEGFAEYVAFAGADDNGPLAGQLLVQAGDRLAQALATTGIPSDLPSGVDFTGGRQEVSYEASRRACAVLAEIAENSRPNSSMAALGAFQQQLGDGASVAEALRAIFDISYQGFLTRWRAELTQTVVEVP